jgi:4'-phosphopantetheinyl transferase EntD
MFETAAGLGALACWPKARLPRRAGVAIEAIGEASPFDAAKLRFVAKAAFYKAVFPSARLFIDFHEVTIDFSRAGGVFEARFLGRPLGGREVPAHALGAFVHPDGNVCAWPATTAE